jgi:hypothetical protein
VLDSETPFIVSIIVQIRGLAFPSSRIRSGVWQNKREWQMTYLLGLIGHEDMINKVSELTKRVFQLEKQLRAINARLEELG